MISSHRAAWLDNFPKGKAMTCDEYDVWLKNKKNVAYQLTSQALSHARSCEKCRAKLQPDNAMDALFLAALQKDEDGGEGAGFDFPINAGAPVASSTRYRVYGLLGALVAVAIIFAIALLFY